MPRKTLPFLFLLSLAFIIPVAAQPFQGVAPADGWDDTIVTNVSADGRVLVGLVRTHSFDGEYYTLAKSQAFRWQNGELTLLNSLPGHTYGEAVDVSADGSVIVGTSCARGDDIEGIDKFTCRGVRWSGTSVTPLPFIDADFEEGEWHQAYAVSGSGNVVAGYLAENFRYGPTRWAGGPPASQVPDLANEYPHAISDDGSVMAVARSSPQRSDIFGYSDRHIYRVVGQAATQLPLPPGAAGGAVLDMSGDGSVIVGSVRGSDNNNRPVLWGPSGLEELPLPDSAMYGGVVTAASSDGTVLVGSYLLDGFDRRLAIWRFGKFADVNAELEARGIDVGEISLDTPTGVSGDGTVIVGRAFGSPDANSYRIELTGPFFRPESAFMKEDSLFWPDSTYTLRWGAPLIQTVEIHASLEAEPDPERDADWPIVVGTGIDAFNVDSLLWTIPAQATSPTVWLRIRDENDPTQYTVSERARVRYGWQLSRVATEDGSDEKLYEFFTPQQHGWRYANTRDVWFPDLWFILPQFDYPGGGEDPNTLSPYPNLFRMPSIDARPTFFPDWPSWASAFLNTYAPDHTGNFSQVPYHVKWWSVLGGAGRDRGASYDGTNWLGGCYGQTVLAMMMFSDPDKTGSTFPGLTAQRKLYDLSTSPSSPAFAPIRETVNMQFTKQVADVVRAETQTNFKKEVSVHLDTLKAALLTDDTADDVILNFCGYDFNPVTFTWYKKGCHSTLPFLITPHKDGSHTIGVYDPNFPGVSQSFVVGAGGGWSFNTSHWNWTGRDFKYGASVERITPLWNAMSFTFTSGGAPKNRSHAQKYGPGVHNDALTVYTGANIVITRDDGRTIGTEDGEAFSTFDDEEASALMFATGGPSAPYGYSLPMATYRADVTPGGEGVQISVEAPDGRAHVYSRAETSVGDRDELAFEPAGGLTASNASGDARRIELGMLDASDLRVALLENLALAPSDSMTLGGEGDAIVFNNHGGQTSYDLRVHASSSGQTQTFRSLDVAVAAGSRHTLRPNWSDLNDTPLVIEVDLDADGVPDEVLVLENEGEDAVSIEDGGVDDVPLPDAFALGGPYPNPASGRTTFDVTMPETGDVRVELFDMLGRSVDVLHNGALTAGRHRLTIDAGGFVPGLYVARATRSGGALASRTVTVVR